MFLLKSYECIIKKRVKVKNLQLSLIKQAGRNNKGIIILRGRGGGFKKRYRLIDFTRQMQYIPSYIIRFEYDPNRNLFIVLISYLNGFLSYKLAPTMIKTGFLILNKYVYHVTKGSLNQLISNSTGSLIYNYQLKENDMSRYARTAGAYIQIVRKVGSYSLLRFASGEERFVSVLSYAYTGRLSSNLKKLLKKTKAGTNRNKGFKSKVRGVAKNPIDHPHGGGEGKTTAGQPSVSPWGIYTKGIRTTTRFKRNVKYNYGYFRRRNKQNW